MTTANLVKSVFRAAKAGRVEVIRELLESRTAEERRTITNTKTTGCTPLIIASLNGHTDVVKYLVEFGFADVELKGSAKILFPPVCFRKEAAPLYYAAAGGHQDIVEFLAKNSADTDTRDEKRLSPLHAAARWGRYYVISFLLRENNADVNAVNKFGLTPLYYACMCNHPDVVRPLLQSGAQIIGDSVLGKSHSVNKRALVSSNRDMCYGTFF